MNMERKIIWVKIDEWSTYFFEQEVTELAKWLLKEFQPGDKLQYQEGDEDANDRFAVFRSRLETDEEFTIRKQNQQKTEENMHKRDLAEYERLKKKFGNG